MLRALSEGSIAEKIGCSPETLRKCVRQTEVDSGRRGGVTSEEKARVKELEREVRELRRANEILREASAYFAQAESRPHTSRSVGEAHLSDTPGRPAPRVAL